MICPLLDVPSPGISQKAKVGSRFWNMQPASPFKTIEIDSYAKVKLSNVEVLQVLLLTLSISSLL